MNSPDQLNNTFNPRSLAGIPVTHAAATPERPPSLTDIVALADQLEAATNDVYNAWVNFSFGGDVLTPTPTGL